MAKNTLSSSIHIADWKKELSEMLILGMLTTKINIMCRKVTIAMLVGMFLSLLTSTRAFAYESGKCGDNISWSLSESGTLTLDGSGVMQNYFYVASPWGKKINKVIMLGNITTIGSEAFMGCSRLNSIDFSNSLTSLGKSSFSNCSALIDIIIPNSVTSINFGAFSYCSGLKNLVIGNSVRDIGDYAFHSCNKIKTLVVPNSVESIGNHTFQNCDGLENLTLGISLVNIGDYAFRYCNTLIVIKSLAIIPPKCGLDAFGNVNKFCKLVVPDGCVDAYRQADGWRDFLNITSETGGIGDLDDSNVTVTSVDGKISIAGVVDAIVDVYNTSGALLYSGRSHNIAVPNDGIYFVRINGKTQKVVVR